MCWYRQWDGTVQSLNAKPRTGRPRTLTNEESKEANIPIDQSESKIRKTPSVKGYQTKTEQQLEICDQAINLSRISNKNKAFFYSFS
ncbi:unnamed protein product [Rotaria sordida]|uniref:Uncharacterized protein n=2 Tax=Rotaria sordida TaxID=392033 RepID=A0A814K8U7_9BILA|nr:unnamed protein product [Rotaria sordida]